MLKLNAWMPGSGVGSGDNRIWHEEYGHGCLRVGDTADFVSRVGLQITTYSSNGGVAVDSLFASPELYRFGGNVLKGEYLAQVFKVSIPISYSDTYAANPIPYAWGICSGCFGISAANPNYSKPYCVVEDGSQGVAGCVLNTYVMRLHDNDTGVFDPWCPCPPGQAVATCRVAGVIAPVEASQGESPISAGGGVGPVSYISNPNLGTEIRWRATPSAPVNIKVYDLMGRLIYEVNGMQFKTTGGRFLWKGETRTGRSAPAGVYLISVESAGNKASGKITFMK
jgi:hypothetical protein